MSDPGKDAAALDQLAVLAATGWALSNAEVREILAGTGR